jgi:hypothetical protein
LVETTEQGKTIGESQGKKREEKMQKKDYGKEIQFKGKRHGDLRKKINNMRKKKI